MSTDTDLRARLRDLAEDAPHAGLSGDDLWRTGVRRQRLRRAGSGGAALLAVALVVGLGPALMDRPGPLPPAQAPVRWGLPSVVEPPAVWSEPVASPGPLSAVSIALHRAPDGLTGSSEQLMLFGISATDGVARFLDFPGPHLGNVDPGQVAISPDGTQVATPRWVHEDDRTATRGWDVLDTTTGELTRLRVPGMSSLVGLDTYEISFSGDGRYLLTHFSLTGSTGSRDDSLVVWDVSTGQRFIAEPAGDFWLPSPASGPTGVVWTRGRDVLMFDPVTGERDRLSLPQQLVEAAFSPDGGTLAYIAHSGERAPARGPWTLHVRDAVGEIQQLPVGIEPHQVLGWRDNAHVVVSDYGPRGARVVDVDNGTWEPFGIGQGADSLMTPRYASDLLALPITDAVEQPEVGDPRFWMKTEVQWIGAGMLLGGVLQVWLLIRRRRGRV